MGITAITTYQFGDDADIDSPQSVAWSLVNQELQKLVSSDPQSAAYFGQIVERPRQTQLICDEDDLKKQSQAMISDENKSLRERLNSIHAPISASMRVEFFNPIDAALTAPCTEVVTMYIPLETGQGQWTRDVWDHFSWVLENYAEGLVDLSAGWVLEPVEKDGEKYLGFAALMGWTSLDAHMKFRESKAYKNNVGELSDGCVAIDMHHVVFKAYTREKGTDQAVSS